MTGSSLSFQSPRPHTIINLFICQGVNMPATSQSELLGGATVTIPANGTTVISKEFVLREPMLTNFRAEITMAGGTYSGASGIVLKLQTKLADGAWVDAKSINTGSDAVYAYSLNNDYATSGTSVDASHLPLRPKGRFVAVADGSSNGTCTRLVVERVY